MRDCPELVGTHDLKAALRLGVRGWRGRHPRSYDCRQGMLRELALTRGTGFSCTLVLVCLGSDSLTEHGIQGRSPRR
eukprot:738564-Rhodomonas_salina.1